MDMNGTMGKAAQGNPAMIGMWEPIRYRFKHLPVHTALLRTGKLLAIGGSGNDRKYLENPHPAELFDPNTGDITEVEQNLGSDTFCCGHAFLSDGRLLVAGGTYRFDIPRFMVAAGAVPFPPFSGAEQTYIFDPISEVWTRGPDMAAGRWYPTVIMLPDERVIAVAGLTKRFPWVVLKKTEIYTVGAGWSHFKKADRWMPLYPRLHLLPDGKVFYAGSYNTHFTFPVGLRHFKASILDPDSGFWADVGQPESSQREEGSTIMLALIPPDYKAKVLLMGGGLPGNTEGLPDAALIDLSAAKPAFRPIAPMNHARYYCYSVILPDGKVLVLGGRTGRKGHQMTKGGAMPGMTGDHDKDAPPDPNAVHEAELFDPANEMWTPMASMTVDRLYHSGAVLLPDGRVVATGNNPMPGFEERRIEIYDPPYLFKGDRPTLTQVPEAVTYGESFEIGTPDASDIDTVALIHPISTTHCYSTDQRYVRLVIASRGSGTLVAQVPNNKNVLPPGHYMLFILRGGIPAKARFIHICAEEGTCCARGRKRD